MACVVLAAGLGTRMKSSIPKVLHRLGGKSLLRRSAELALELKMDKRIAVVSPGVEQYEPELPEGFELAVQDKPLGTAHALLSAAPLLGSWDGDVLILCADAPLMTLKTLRNLVEMHASGGYHGTLLTGKLQNPEGYGRVIRKSSGEVQKIVEEIQATIYEKAVEEVNSGTYCFDWISLSDALGELQIQPKKNEIFLTDVVETFVRKRKTVAAVCADDAREILGINSRRQLAEAEKVLRFRTLEHWMDNGVTVIDPQTTYIGEDVTIGEDTIVHPFTVIEGKVSIGKRCEVGPYAHIRNNTILRDGVEIGNFVEVKASTLDEHVKAKHLTYLGDTTIGRKVNVGAGTITANYDGKKKSQTVIGEGAFIGSGTILIAPVRVGKDAVTGAGAVVTRGHDVPDGSVVAGIPARELAKSKKSGENK